MATAVRKSNTTSDSLTVVPCALKRTIVGWYIIECIVCVG